MQYIAISTEPGGLYIGTLDEDGRIGIEGRAQQGEGLNGELYGRVDQKFSGTTTLAELRNVMSIPHVADRSIRVERNGEPNDPFHMSLITSYDIDIEPQLCYCGADHRADQSMLDDDWDDDDGFDYGYEEEPEERVDNADFLTGLMASADITTLIGMLPVEERREAMLGLSGILGAFITLDRSVAIVIVEELEAAARS